MKKLIVFFLAIFMIIFASAAFSENTVSIYGQVVAVSAMDSDYALGGGNVVSIEFFGGAVNDRLVIKNGSDSGPVLFDRIVSDLTFPPIKYFFNSWLTPVIDFSDCTLSAGHKIVFIKGK